jgi:hypothetical protein
MLFHCTSLAERLGLGAASIVRRQLGSGTGNTFMDRKCELLPISFRLPSIQQFYFLKIRLFDRHFCGIGHCSIPRDLFERMLLQRYVVF